MRKCGFTVFTDSIHASWLRSCCVAIRFQTVRPRVTPTLTSGHRESEKAVRPPRSQSYRWACFSTLFIGLSLLSLCQVAHCLSILEWISSLSTYASRVGPTAIEMSKSRFTFVFFTIVSQSRYGTDQLWFNIGRSGSAARFQLSPSLKAFFLKSCLVCKSLLQFTNFASAFGSLNTAMALLKKICIFRKSNFTFFFFFQKQECCKMQKSLVLSMPFDVLIIHSHPLVVVVINFLLTF